MAYFVAIDANLFQPIYKTSWFNVSRLFRLWSLRWTGWGCWWTSRTAPCRPRWTRSRWARQINTCSGYLVYKLCNVCILYQHIIFTHHIYCVYKHYLHIFVHIISTHCSYLHTVYLHNISTQYIYTQYLHRWARRRSSSPTPRLITSATQPETYLTIFSRKQWVYTA